LDATLVKGSHGVPTAPEFGPLIITQHANGLPGDHIAATAVYGVLAAHLGITADDAVPAPSGEESMASSTVNALMSRLLIASRNPIDIAGLLLLSHSGRRYPHCSA